MKVRALRTTHGSYGRKPVGEVFDVSEGKYKELHDDKIKEGKRPVVKKVNQNFANRKTKPDFPTKYKYEQNGSWFAIYRGEKQVDKFQGAEGLKKYGLYAKYENA